MHGRVSCIHEKHRVGTWGGCTKALSRHMNEHDNPYRKSRTGKAWLRRLEAARRGALRPGGLDGATRASAATVSGAPSSTSDPSDAYRTVRAPWP
jgi:hypothetical protein